MKENISDTKAKNSDFAKYSYAEEFDVAKAEEGKLGRLDVWILTLQAKNNKGSLREDQAHDTQGQADSPSQGRGTSPSPTAHAQRSISSPPTFKPLGASCRRK